MNCKKYQTEIEQSFDGTNLSAQVSEHLKTCPTCRQFEFEQFRLQRILRDLPAVETPPNFNFRLRARLNVQREAAVPVRAQWQKWVMFPSSALAALIIAFFLVKNISLVSPPPSNLSALSSPTINQKTEFADKDPEVVRDVVQIQTPANVLTVNSTRNANEQKHNKPKIDVARKTIRRKISTKAKPDAAPNRATESISSHVLALKAAPPPLVANSSSFAESVNAPLKQNSIDVLKAVGVITKSENLGLRVVSVEANSQAARSGLQVNDFIQKINNEDLFHLTQRNFKIESLTLIRNDKIEQLKLREKP